MASAHSRRVTSSKVLPSSILCRRLSCARHGAFLLLFLLALLYFLLQRRLVPSWIPEGIQKQSIEDMNAKNSDGDAVRWLGKAGVLAGNVLGVSTMPDQCRKGNGSEFPFKTEAKYDLMKKGPFHFLPDYRNPCWEHPENGKLMCLPYFYLAGFPKCGTTDMYVRIAAHPHVLLANKEPHWITRGRLKGTSLEKYAQRYTKFLAAFLPEEKKQYVMGDGSASLAWDNAKWMLAPGNEGCSEPRVLNADYLRHLLPTAKVLFMLRNPTDRLYSEYLFFSPLHKDQKTFHTDVTESVDRFNLCLTKDSIRTCAYATLDTPLRIYVGLYTVYIEDWLLRFPREQLMFVRLEDVHDGSTVLPSVFKFLELETANEITLKHIAAGDKQNVGAKKRKTGPMWNRTRVLLDAFYRPYNIRLAQVLQDRRYAWQNDDVVV